MPCENPGRFPDIVHYGGVGKTHWWDASLALPRHTGGTVSRRPPLRTPGAHIIAVPVRPGSCPIRAWVIHIELAIQRKCLERIARFRAQGRTILLVAHEMTLIRDICDDALWLRTGRVAGYGPVHEVADQYEAAAEAESRGPLPIGPPATLDTVESELR